jgi:two-component system sensor histidine kinase KdpD
VVRRSTELKSALLASLSHDLRTPLTAVMVAANNLNASWLSPEQRREQTDIVLAELERLNRLFHNLVEMARIDTNAVAPEREWVHPAEIVEAAVRQVEHSLAGHRVEVDIAAEGTLVRLDPQLTSAALAHVLENAAQYSPPASEIACNRRLVGEIRSPAVEDGIAEISVVSSTRFYRGERGIMHSGQEWDWR